MPHPGDNLPQFRRDVITALTKLQTSISALEYAVSGNDPNGQTRLRGCQSLAKEDVQLVRQYFERHIRQIP